MKNTIIFFLLTVLLLTGCNSLSNEEIVETALAETAAVAPSETPVPTHTATATITQTPTAKSSPTNTPTSTPTLTPTPDLRVINGAPVDFQLKKTDLPVAGNYYIPNEFWSSPHLNSEVISGWTVEAGKAYIADTGRITGWWTAFAIGTSTQQMPETIFCNVIQYQTSEGARKSVIDYTRVSKDDEGIWETVDRKIELGDYNSIEQIVERTAAGRIKLTYEISLSYYNYAISCYGYGYNEDVSHEFVENVVSKMLAKLEKAELIEP